MSEGVVWKNLPQGAQPQRQSLITQGTSRGQTFQTIRLWASKTEEDVDQSSRTKSGHSSHPCTAWMWPPIPTKWGPQYWMLYYRVILVGLVQRVTPGHFFFGFLVWVYMYGLRPNYWNFMVYLCTKTISQLKKSENCYFQKVFRFLLWPGVT